jgi:hypothetical protein
MVAAGISVVVSELDMRPVASSIGAGAMLVKQAPALQAASRITARWYSRMLLLSDNGKIIPSVSIVLTDDLYYNAS